MYAYACILSACLLGIFNIFIFAYKNVFLSAYHALMSISHAVGWTRTDRSDEETV